MNIFKNPQKEIWEDLVKRPTLDIFNLRDSVAEIFNEVKEKKDEALRFFTHKFDGIYLDSLVLDLSTQSLESIEIADELKKAIQQAKDSIWKFHEAQKDQEYKIETQKGVECWRMARPIEKIGLYVPGGSAPLFSTVLMLVIPAMIAGCKEIILCTPPNKFGEVHPAIRYAAKLCGVDKIYKIGGAQAIAAMCLGTETVPQVYKIFGPGNQYVTAAKQHVQEYGVSIDMPAGPSEVLVIADGSANAAFCAADLLSQAEHGADSQVVFLSNHQPIFDATLVELKKQLHKLPRKEIAEKAIKNSNFILFNDLARAIDFSNMYAPEHLILAVYEAENYLPKITNAGSVFLGNYSCESAGDYASGTNHTLPTNAYARNYSGVSLDSFVKKITVQKLSAEGIRNIGPTVELMAEAEGLFAHKNAITLRLKDIE